MGVCVHGLGVVGIGGGRGGGAYGDDPCGPQDDEEDDEDHPDAHHQLTVPAEVAVLVGALQLFGRHLELLGLGERESGGMSAERFSRDGEEPPGNTWQPGESWRP